MGWGLVAASRAKLLDNCTLGDDKGKLDATIVDMCSEARRVTGGPRPRSAASVANAVCTSLWKRTNHLLVVFYDNHARMHAQRSVLWSKRYRRLTDDECRAAEAKGKVVIDGAAYAPSSLPYTPEEVALMRTNASVVWPRLWCTQHGKKKAFSLISAAMVEWHHKNYVDGSGRRFVSWHADTPLSYPYNDADARDVARRCCSNTFGEADSMVSEALKVIGPDMTVNVQTIDTDMILQIVASRTAHTWRPSRLRLLNETINVADLVRQFGNDDYPRRLTSAFWLLACNGVDYCKGLTRFGFNTAALLQLASKPTKPLFVLCDAHAAFESDTFLSLLAATKRRRVKNRDWGDFHSEVSAILFCISLFSGALCQRVPCGGPDLVECAVSTTEGATPFDDASLAAAKACAQVPSIVLGA
ncbi:MAG: hypothetical protein VW491_07270 [Gammaproteobacteria bacterium]